MPPGKLKLFYLYLVVIVLFGWLGLAISDSSPNHCPPQNNKKTFGDETDFCDSAHQAGPEKRILNALTKGVNNQSMTSLIMDITFVVSQKSGNVPYVGKFIKFGGSLLKGQDPQKRCFAYLSKKITKGFDEIKGAIEESTRKIINELKVVNFQILFTSYNALVQSVISQYLTTIGFLIDPETSNSYYYDQLNKTCDDIDKGILALANRFRDFNTQSCISLARYYNVTLERGKDDSTLSATTCIPVMIRNTYPTYRSEERYELLKRLALDGVNLMRILTFCTTIKAMDMKEDNPDDEKKLAQLHNPMNNLILTGAAKARDLIMEVEVRYMQQREEQVRKAFEAFFNAVKKPKHDNFWIEKLPANKLKYFFQIFENATLILADGSANYRVLHCPNTTCFFIPNFCNMHIMYSEPTRTGVESYKEYLDLILKLSSDVENANIDSYSPHYTLEYIIDQFVELAPIRRSSVGFDSAALFYKNDTNLNFDVGLKTQYVQYYFHRTISVKGKGSIVKVVAPTNQYLSAANNTDFEIENKLKMV
jgi:hypothetical protein